MSLYPNNRSFFSRPWLEHVTCSRFCGRRVAALCQDPVKRIHIVLLVMRFHILLVMRFHIPVCVCVCWSCFENTSLLWMCPFWEKKLPYFKYVVLNDFFFGMEFCQGEYSFFTGESQHFSVDLAQDGMDRFRLPENPVVQLGFWTNSGGITSVSFSS